MPIVHKEATMSREELNQIRYVIAFISEFARKFNLGQKQAFNYLKHFKGLDYLYSFYDVLHTQSFEDAIHDISIICLRNGGELQNYRQWYSIMTLTEGQIEIMKEDISAELICLLMQNWHFSQQEAVDILYNSDTFNRLQDEQTGLFYQSAGYVYSYLQQALTTGDYRR